MAILCFITATLNIFNLSVRYYITEKDLIKQDNNAKLQIKNNKNPTVALNESGSFIALAYERNAFPNRGEKCGPTLTFSLTFSNPVCKKGCPTFGTALY